MNKKFHLIVAIVLFNLTKLNVAVGLNIAPADCTYSVINSWMQTITYQCASSVNLNGATLQFTVDNPI